MARSADDQERPEWDWMPEEAEQDAGDTLYSATIGPESAERPMPGTVDRAHDVVTLEAALGHDRLVSAMAGGATLSSDKAAWTKARKALSDYKRGRRGVKKGIGEPYRSRLNALLPAAKRAEKQRSRQASIARTMDLGRATRLRIKMTIHAKVSNDDKLLYVDTDLSGWDKDHLLRGALARNPSMAIFIALAAWGGGLQYRVVRIYDVYDVSIKK